MKHRKELEAKEHLTKQILHALSTDQHVPEILQSLRSREPYDNIVEWLNLSEGHEGHSLTGSLHPTLELSDHEAGDTSSTLYWTAVISDSNILDHLFQLYFAWIHPVHTLFSQGHFINSFRNKSHLYCSPVLVNAICALACHLDINSETDEIQQLAHSFSDAVRSDIDPHDRSITTVQAFSVMFLVDCARGRGLRAASYLRVANSSLSKAKISEDEAFPEVLRTTSRGIRCLDVYV